MLKKTLACLLLASGLLAVGTSGATDLKIGFVNSQRVLTEAPQAAKAKKKMESDFSRRDLDLQKMAKQLQSLQESVEKNSPTLAEADRAAKEREFSDLNRDFQRKQREFKEDLNIRQNEEMAKIFERVNKVIKNIAETEKYDLILQEAVYASPRIDLTDKIIKMLGDDGK